MNILNTSLAEFSVRTTGPGEKIEGLVAHLAKQSDPGEKQEEIQKAAKKLEAYFIGYLLQEMRKTVPDGLLSSDATKNWYYFYDHEIGRLAAESGGVGLGNFWGNQLEGDHQVLNLKETLHFLPQDSDKDSESL